MQLNRTGGAVGDATSYSVSVTRGWGDTRTVRVPKDALRNVHFATDQGGDRKPLPRQMVAAYMFCDLIPDGAPFGHTCMHGPGPHSIKVLIRSTDNERRVYVSLKKAAGRAKLRKRYRVVKPLS